MIADGLIPMAGEYKKRGSNIAGVSIDRCPSAYGIIGNKNVGASLH